MAKTLTFTEEQKLYNKHYATICKQAQNKLGTGWNMVGPQIRRAFVAQEILGNLALQDDQYVSADAVRQMMDALYARLNNDAELSL